MQTHTSRWLRNYWTIDETAVRFNTTPDTLRSWREHGYGPVPVLAGRKVFYADAEIRRWSIGLSDPAEVN